MTSTRCKCGVQTNYGMTCVRCRQEVYRSRYAPVVKEPVEPVAPVEETEEEVDDSDLDV